MTVTSSNRYIHLEVNGELKGKTVIDLDYYLPTKAKRFENLLNLIDLCPEPLRTTNRKKLTEYLTENISRLGLTKLAGMYLKNYEMMGGKLE